MKIIYWSAVIALILAIAWGSWYCRPVYKSNLLYQDIRSNNHLPSSQDWYSVTYYGNDRFMAMPMHVTGTVMYSVDCGATWSSVKPETWEQR